MKPVACVPNAGNRKHPAVTHWPNLKTMLKIVST